MTLSIRFILPLLLCLWGCDRSGSASDRPTEFTASGSRMGSDFYITALSENEALAREAVQAAFDEVDRIESLISSWDPHSETAAINRNAGAEPVTVSRELYDLIVRANKISRLTGGAFDISYASMDAIWKFDGTMEQIPSDSALKESVALIDYRRIDLDPDSLSVFLPRAGMKIGFGAIGKGYAANRCKAVMESMGIENGLVNAGGDLINWGRQADGRPWTIGVANPDLKNSALSWLDISGLAVVTSGNYERYVEFDGVRYSHIIDPRTGRPAAYLKSVTVICPDAEVADALATAIFVMGADSGIALADRVAEVECFIVDDCDSLHHSAGIEVVYEYE